MSGKDNAKMSKSSKKNCTKNKKGVLIKYRIHQEDITIRYTQQIHLNLKGEMASNAVLQCDFNTTLPSMERSSRQKINKDMAELKHDIEQMELTLHNIWPNSSEYTSFHQGNETF